MAMEFTQLCDTFEALDENVVFKALRDLIFSDYENKIGVFAIPEHENIIEISAETVYAQVKVNFLFARMVDHSNPNWENELNSVCMKFLDLYKDKEKILGEWIDKAQLN